MVEYPIILDDVRKETADYLGFIKEGEKQLFSKPIYLPRDEFPKRIKKLGLEIGEDVDVKGLIAFRDGNIYLNEDVLEGNQFEQWLFAVLTYFQPYAYVLEETEYGKWVSEEAKSGKGLEGLGSNLLGGICRAVEIDTIKKYRNYYSRDVEREIMKDLKEPEEGEDEVRKKEVQEGYKIIRDLQDRAKNSKDEMDDITRARIIKAALKVVGRNKKFDSNLKDMYESWEIHEIYREAGAEIHDPPKYAGDVQKLAEEIRDQTGSKRPAHKIVPKIQKLIRRLDVDIGYNPDETKKLEETLNNLLKYQEYYEYKEIPDEYKDTIISQMDAIISGLDLVKERRRKIFFR